jgi:hypothetical protein
LSCIFRSLSEIALALRSIDAGSGAGVGEASNWSVATVVVVVTRTDEEIGGVEDDIEMGTSET